MLDGLKKAIKRIIGKVQQKRREEELKQSQPHVTAAQITADLKKMGIEPGDILFIHSSLKSLGYVDGGPKAVIQGLLDAVGPEGTLLLPTYYMPGGSILGTCQLEGYVFDPRIHGTNMGALPEAFLRFSGVQRSIHPTHSVSAIGKHAKYLTEAHQLAPSVFGRGSPWQRFHELNGKVLGIGISMGPVTFYHLLEDTSATPFLFPSGWKKPTKFRVKAGTERTTLSRCAPIAPRSLRIVSTINRGTIFDLSCTSI